MATDVPFEFSDELTAALDRAIAASLDLTPAMRDIAGHLGDAARARFESETSPLGVPWKKSGRVTGYIGRDGKPVAGDGGKTLTLSGDLGNSMAEDWGKDFAAAGPEASGGAAIYAAIHQFGGTIVPRTGKALSFAGSIVAKVVIAARPYLGWNDESQSYAIDAIVARLNAAFGGAGIAGDGAASA